MVIFIALSAESLLGASMQDKDKQTGWGKIKIEPSEMDKLCHAWEFHRKAFKECVDKRDVTIEYRSGGGIGTRTFLVCGCGKEVDITNYHSW